MVRSGTDDESLVRERSLTLRGIVGYTAVMLRHLAALGAGLLLLALLVLGGVAVGRGGDEPLRIGISPWPGAEVLFLADTQGRFTTEGLEVDLIEYASFGDVASAFAHGDIDAMLCSTHEVVTVAARSRRRPVVVRVTDISDGADQILIGPALTGIGDLAGRRVGVEVASVGIELLDHALASVGLAIDAVTIVPGEPAGIPEAFRSGAIDAAVSYQPYVDQIKAAGGRSVFTSSGLRQPIISVFAIEQDWLTRHPHHATAFALAFSRAVEWIAAHPAQAAAHQGARLGLSAEDFAAQAAQVRLLTAAQANAYRRSGRALAALQHSAALLQKLGTIGTVDLRGTVADDQ